MKYYVFKKDKDGSDWLTPVTTKKIYSTTEFDLAQIRYDAENENLKLNEVLFLAADFGISNEKKRTDYVVIEPDKRYIPFFVIKCSDNDYFNYEKMNMKNVRIILMTEGINQTYFNPEIAFEKFDYYLDNRIKCILAVNYVDSNSCEQICPVSDIMDILLYHDKLKFIKRFGFVLQQQNVVKIGPFTIKKRVEY